MSSQPTAELSNEALLDSLAPYETLRNFAPGRTVFEEGVPPDGIHVLLSGTVDLLFLGRKDPSPVRISGGGTILGLSSLVSGRSHEYTATAASEVLTGYVDKKTFMQVLNDSPVRWFDVLQILSRDISSCYDRVREISERRHAAH